MSKGFDPASVRARVSERNTQLAACFAEARRTDPRLWGRLAFVIILEVDGTVHRLSEVESHFPNANARFTRRSCGAVHDRLSERQRQTVQLRAGDARLPASNAAPRSANQAKMTRAPGQRGAYDTADR